MLSGKGAAKPDAVWHSDKSEKATKRRPVKKAAAKRKVGRRAPGKKAAAKKA
jgi:hypothetical protein